MRDDSWFYSIGIVHSAFLFCFALYKQFKYSIGKIV